MKFLVKTMTAGAIALALLATGCSAEQPQHKPTEPAEPAVSIYKSGILERSSGQPPVNDDQVDTAYEHATKVLGHFEDTFAWNSYDGKGSTLKIRIGEPGGNPLVDYPNEWERELHYILSDEGIGLEDTAYLFAHGVIQHVVDLEGEGGESSAVAHAIAEILTRGVDGNWTLVDEQGKIARDAANPKLYQLPAHVRQYERKPTTAAAARNSMILTHAIYLLERKVGADTTQQIVWNALTKDTKEGDGFHAFRNACLKAADDLRATAPGVDFQRAVVEAFDEVGVTKSWKSPFDS